MKQRMMAIIWMAALGAAAGLGGYGCLYLLGFIFVTIGIDIDDGRIWVGIWYACTIALPLFAVILAYILSLQGKLPGTKNTSPDVYAGVSQRDLAISLLERRKYKSSMGFFYRTIMESYLSQLLTIVLLLVLLNYVFQVGTESGFYHIIISLYAGALLRDLAIFGVLKEKWPFQEKVTDWVKVEELANGQSRTSTDAMGEMN